MLKLVLRWLSVVGVLAGGVAIAATFAVGGPGHVVTDGDTPVVQGGLQPLSLAENEEYRNLSDLAFTSRRLAGDVPLDLTDAGDFRAEAAKEAKKLRKHGIIPGPPTFTGAWSQVGPNPISQQLRTSGALGSMSGRIGALACTTFRKNVVRPGAIGERISGRFPDHVRSKLRSGRSRCARLRPARYDLA